MDCTKRAVDYITFQMTARRKMLRILHLVLFLAFAVFCVSWYFGKSKESSGILFIGIASFVFAVISWSVFGCLKTGWAQLVNNVLELILTGAYAVFYLHKSLGIALLAIAVVICVPICVISIKDCSVLPMQEPARNGHVIIMTDGPEQPLE